MKKDIQVKMLHLIKIELLCGKVKKISSRTMNVPITNLPVFWMSLFTFVISTENVP